MWRPKRIYLLVYLVFVIAALTLFFLWGRASSWTGILTPGMHSEHHHHSDHRHYHSNNPALARDTVAERAEHGGFTITTQNSSKATGAMSVNGTGTQALLRVLVLTYNRADSLRRCLASINAAKYDSQQVVVDIHVDRARDGTLHNATLRAARDFHFLHGSAQVHVRPRHVGVVGQWLSSWRVPGNDSLEIAVMVEDDLTLSPYYARWLRHVHAKYDRYPAIAGYSLQSECMRHAVGTDSSPLQPPPGHCVFLYPILGSWGSPLTQADGGSF